MPATPPRDPSLVMVKAEPFNAETPLSALQQAITPAAQHYVRSNFALPEHDGRISVGGAVDTPLSLTLDDLQSLGTENQTVTLECAGNGRVGLMPLPTGEPWTGQAVGTATWTGVPLARVLERAAPQTAGREVVFTGADHGHFKGGPDIHFVRSLTLARALDPGAHVLIAWAMNDEPLPPDHGAPLRLVVPGWYGMASVKWLKGITVQPAPYEGQFQTRSYVYEWQDQPREPVMTIRPRAFILAPEANSTLARGPVTVRGRAWSGAGPITSVEVSVEGAGEWLPAEVTPPTAPFAWQDWTFTWKPSMVGRHVLRARATDTTGATQPDSPAWNRLGYGNNAVQVLTVDVR